MTARLSPDGNPGEWFGLVVVAAVLWLWVLLGGAGCAATSHDLYNHPTTEDGKVLLDINGRICEPIFVAFTPDIPQAYREPIAAGFDYWDVLGFSMFKTITEITMDDPHVLMPAVLVVAKAGQNEVGRDTFMKTTMTAFDENGCARLMRMLVSTPMLTMYSLDQVTNAARHEAGHLLGLTDRKEPATEGSVMFWRLVSDLSYPREVWADELAALRALHAQPTKSVP